MKKLLLIAAMAVCATTAQAQIDVELAFDPAIAYPGDTVTMFASIANLGDAEVVADIEVTITSGDLVVGPLAGMLPLAAGEELSNEFVFIVPPVPFGGDLTISVTATADGWSDTATATLTVVVDEGSTGEESDLRDLGNGFIQNFAGVVPDEGMSFGRVKSQYR